MSTSTKGKSRFSAVIQKLVMGQLFIPSILESNSLISRIHKILVHITMYSFTTDDVGHTTNIIQKIAELVYRTDFGKTLTIRDNYSYIHVTIVLELKLNLYVCFKSKSKENSTTTLSVFRDCNIRSGMNL